MIWILSGTVALLAGLLLLRSFTAADPARVAQWMRYGVAAIVLSLAAFLIVTGRIAIALLLAGWAILWMRKKPSTAPRRNSSPHSSQNHESPRARGGLSPKEALDILGLKSGATREEIREAHKRLMQACHPDHGGSGYLAARINAAKDVLLS